jgi:hypothetical protein
MDNDHESSDTLISAMTYNIIAAWILHSAHNAHTQFLQGDGGNAID